MAVRHVIKKDLTPRIVSAVNGLKGRAVEVGVFDGEQAYIAGIHEYGCRIPVTQKMRGWVGAHGLHLRKGTEWITIPERSFLRAGFDAHISDVNSLADQLIAALADGTIDADTVLEAVGTQLEGDIKEYATALRDPANHPFTVEQKSSSNPLVDTGAMIGAITHRVR